MKNIPGVYTAKSLAAAYGAHEVEEGTFAWTSDLGPMWSDGQRWIATIPQSGLANLVNGQALVLASSVKADSIIMLTAQAASTSGKAGQLYIGERNVGLFFTIQSTEPSERGLIGWSIVDGV